MQAASQGQAGRRGAAPQDSPHTQPAPGPACWDSGLGLPCVPGPRLHRRLHPQGRVSQVCGAFSRAWGGHGLESPGIWLGSEGARGGPGAPTRHRAAQVHVCPHRTAPRPRQVGPREPSRWDDKGCTRQVVTFTERGAAQVVTLLPKSGAGGWPWALEGQGRLSSRGHSCGCRCACGREEAQLSGGTGRVPGPHGSSTASLRLRVRAPGCGCCRGSASCLRAHGLPGTQEAFSRAPRARRSPAQGSSRSPWGGRGGPQGRARGARPPACCVHNGRCEHREGRRSRPTISQVTPARGAGPHWPHTVSTSGSCKSHCYKYVIRGLRPGSVALYVFIAAALMRDERKSVFDIPPGPFPHRE